VDIRTGRSYSTEAEALDAGVPVSDIAHVAGEVVRFKNGPFKERVYRRNASGQLELIGGKMTGKSIRRQRARSLRGELSRRSAR
jgi:hypothetical protein